MVAEMTVHTRQTGGYFGYSNTGETATSILDLDRRPGDLRVGHVRIVPEIDAKLAQGRRTPCPGASRVYGKRPFHAANASAV